MFKPHKNFCCICEKETIVVVKAMFCARCNEAQKRAKKGLPTKRPPLNQRSEKREKLDALYSIVSKQYLKDHPKCEANIQGVCSFVSKDIHHLYSGANRSKYYIDETTFKAVCRNCHTHIHSSMSADEAISLGLKK